ncbi:MAG: OmpA family protein [Cocleimonas sp.]
MHKVLKTVLLSSTVVFMSQNSYAEPFPVPNWNNEQAPIAWGDCIPVPVVPMGSPSMNMLPQGMPMGANQALAPMPFPMLPMPVNMNQAPMILPPPSPFFNTSPPIAPLVAIQPKVSCDNKDKLALTELQLKYNLAAKASKNKIQEITQTLEDAQNQMADSQHMLVNANKDNLEQKEKYSKLETKITGLLSTSEKLKSSNNNAKNTFNSLQAELTKSQNDLSAKTRMITVLSQNQAELAALKSTYKERNDENQQLKIKITDLENNAGNLEAKLKSSSTSLTLKSAQDNEIISSLKKKLAKLDDTNKTLTTNLSKAETNAGSQARKLTALGRSTTELTALQSAYKARNDENALLKKQLAKLKSSHTSSTLKGAQDSETISGLKNKLKNLTNENITIKTQLTTASTAAGSQTRKLAALGQSANELLAIKSAYKERNDETEALKLKLAELNTLKKTSDAACDLKSTDLQSKLSNSQDSYKTLLAKVATLETESANQARKITVLTSSSNELTALKSAYKDLNSKKETISTQLATATADTDKDGVLDSSDKCPSSPFGSHVNELGCPKVQDADNDGVADASDLCKNSAAGSTVNEFGCTPTENITLKGVTFNTGSAQLTAASLPILDAAANTLNQNPNLKIEIAGYTDNSGIAEINKNLSKRRANTVMIHLIKKGVDAVRLTAKGYGEQAPVASNATADGRATNRRVELKIN